MPFTPADYLDIISFAEADLKFGMWIYEPARDSMRWSRGMFELLGLTSREIEPGTDTIRKMTHPEDARLRRNPNGVSPDFRVITKSGDVVWLRQHSRLLHNCSGRAYCMAGVVVDVSAHHTQDSAIALTPAIGMDARMLRISRAYLGLSLEAFAEACNVSSSSIRRLEETEGRSVKPATMLMVYRTLVSLGIEHYVDASGNWQVRFESVASQRREWRS